MILKLPLTLTLLVTVKVFELEHLYIQRAPTKILLVYDHLSAVCFSNTIHLSFENESQLQSYVYFDDDFITTPSDFLLHGTGVILAHH